MDPFTTDRGTLRLLDDLTGAGRQVLYGFLRNCDAMRAHGIGEDRELHGIHFVRRGIRVMRLKRRSGDTARHVLATTDFTDGTQWRRGTYRIPGVSLPEAVMATCPGMLIEDVVQGAPIAGFRITGAKPGKVAGEPWLYLRSEGGEAGVMPYEAPPARWS